MGCGGLGRWLEMKGRRIELKLGDFGSGAARRGEADGRARAMKLGCLCMGHVKKRSIWPGEWSHVVRECGECVNVIKNAVCVGVMEIKRDVYICLE